MFEWCSENIQGITFIKIDSHFLKQNVKEYQLHGCYVKDSVKGSRIYHSFIPRKSETQMTMISADLSTTNAKNVSDFNLGMYIVCIYDRDGCIDIISDISVEFDEMYVKFMKREVKAFMWPKKDDKY